MPDAGKFDSDDYRGNARSRWNTSGSFRNGWFALTMRTSVKIRSESLSMRLGFGLHVPNPVFRMEYAFGHKLLIG